ncbi:heat-shock protein [Streptomyces sp. IMTB 2501]|uniref:RNA-binding S4 domain-containing protein n=1 Tax=Streptomyces sp. IMTB 2501 TaxID=1776340 RepID=UPI00096FE1D1|nr:RNA-binding S4 domain-containing protein [Streptomyces sp. IMTB 2501]OLZ68106.1 heat-shock protein [Streptomyces sp. IMTB 2501]
MASEDADEIVNRGTDGPDGTSPAQDAQGSAVSEDQPVDPKVAAAVAAAEAAGPANGETVRIDSWIWAVRLIKTRSLGATACRGGHVHVNGERVKPAYSVRVGDEVRLRHEGRERIVIVKRLIRKRVGAPVATQCYVDNSPPPPPREAVTPAGLRDRGTGRPTKRDRRELERLRGLASPGAPGGLGAWGGAPSPGGFAGLGGPGGRGGSGSGGPGGSDGRSGSGAGGHGESGRSGKRGGSSGTGRHA